MSSTINKYILYLSGIFFIAIGYLLLSTYVNDDLIVPSINQIFVQAINIIKNKEIISALIHSLFRVLMCLLISTTISIAVGFLYFIFKSSMYFFKPLLGLMKASPLAIVSIYLFLSIGSERAPYLITIMMILPISIEGFIAAIDNIDNIFILQLKTESVPKITKFFKIYLPMILPYIIMCLLQTFGLGIKVMMMGEYICQTNNSLGQVIYWYKSTFSFDVLLALLIIIVILVLIIEIIINLISKKLINNKN